MKNCTQPFLKSLIALTTLLFVSLSTAKTDVTGMWFTCLPSELGSKNNPFELLRIKYVGKQIHWTSEWGVGFSATGRGFRQDDGLNLMGCHYLHGKVLANCNVNQPPKHLFLAKPFFTAPATKAALDTALRSRQPIPTSAKRWDQLALACEALTSKMHPPVATTKTTQKPAGTQTMPAQSNDPRINDVRVNTAFPAYR